MSLCLAVPAKLDHGQPISGRLAEGDAVTDHGPGQGEVLQMFLINKLSGKYQTKTDNNNRSMLVVQQLMIVIQ